MVSRKGCAVSVQTPLARLLRQHRSLKRLASGCATAAIVVVSVGAFAPAQASAAKSVESCFSYGGVRYQNLSTTLLYSQGGYWHYWRGTNWVTDSRGCVRYNISYAYREVRATIKAVGSVPEWRGMFVGYSPAASPRGRGSWNLGEGQLSFYYLPATVQTSSEWGVNTNEWLNEVSGSVNCSSSPAMQVACWMDQHGMHGNVVVIPKDSDEDGWTDAEDRYPENKYYR